MEPVYLFLVNENDDSVIGATKADPSRSGQTVDYGRRDGEGRLLVKGEALLVKPEDTGWKVFNPLGRMVKLRERAGSGPGGEQKIEERPMYHI